MNNVKSLLANWRRAPEIGGNFEHFFTAPSRAGDYSKLLTNINIKLVELLSNRGIEHLYEHQIRAVNLIQQGKNVVIATGTASGKTWCYNLSVLNACMEEDNARSLYIFPTKALTHDQFENLQAINQEIYRLTGSSIPVNVYDGDTSASSRSSIRNSTSILLTNPDMLHIGILPHHTLWNQFFKDLRFIVIDELHIYRGVFGSHVSNVIRRLKRIAHFYGGHPQFILTSATIANPLELASNLIELPVEIVDEDTAPKGEKNFIFYNPPITHKEIGLRRNAISEVVALASDLIRYKVQSVLFCRTRRTVENIILRLRQEFPSNIVRGYRSGYLPSERREIEKELRNGEALIVAATNALELGIDIGNLDCVILVGYPGTIAAALQQSGRSGRRSGDSLTIFLATNSPLDQFLINHPEYLLERSPERALIDQNNLLILIQHLKCAFFELPYTRGEKFGEVDKDLLENLIEILESEQYIHKSNQKYFWAADKYPANDISLRSASGNIISLEAVDEQSSRTIGVVDQASAMWMVHPQAVYIHEGQTYLVDELDIENHRAILYPFRGDYYTEPMSSVDIELINVIKSEQIPGGEHFFGEVMVKSQVTGFQQVRWLSQERLAQYSLDMPEIQLRTTAFWIKISSTTIDMIRAKGLWKSDRNNYGANWERQRQLARERDQFTCQSCGAHEIVATHHVHHKVPFRQFRTYQEANRIENLITLCPSCHHKAEIVVKMRSGLAGLSYVLSNLAPIYVMCDTADLGVYWDPEFKYSEDALPIILMYEHIPGGVGLGDALFRVHNELLKSALELVRNCSCLDGCPACVGPAGEKGTGGKPETIALLQVLNGLEIADA